MARKDATEVFRISPMKAVEPFMIKSRTEAAVYFQTQCDLTKTLPFIEEFNKNVEPEKKLTLFHIIICSFVRVFAKYPHVNRFIAGCRYWQRNLIVYSFVIKKQLKLGAKESIVKVSFSPYSTIDSVRKRVYDFVYRARSKKGNATEASNNFFAKLPFFLKKILFTLGLWLSKAGKMLNSLSKADPLFSSTFIANMGSVGLEGRQLHHMYEWGNASFFMVINKIHKAPLVTKEGNIEAREIVDIGFALDERIADGMYFVNPLEQFRQGIINPEILVEEPVFTQEEIDDMAICDPRDKKKYKAFLKRRKMLKKENLLRVKKKKQARKKNR